MSHYHFQNETKSVPEWEWKNYKNWLKFIYFFTRVIDKRFIICFKTPSSLSLSIHVHDQPAHSRDVKDFLQFSRLDFHSFFILFHKNSFVNAIEHKKNIPPYASENVREIKSEKLFLTLEWIYLQLIKW